MIYKALQSEQITKTTIKRPLELRVIYKLGEVKALQVDHEIVEIINEIETVKNTGFDRWTDDNKRPVRDSNDNIVTEDYISNEITGYTEAELDSEGNVITVSIPIYTDVTRTRNVVEGEVEYWLRTLGIYINPAVQKSL